MKIFKLLIFSLILTITHISAWAVSPANEDADYAQGERYLNNGEYLDALKAFGKAAKNGNSDAQYRIGMMFLEGEGMNANPEDAAYWFRKAAQNGHAPSQFAIGECFMKGIGVQQDSRMAAEWFWRAAEQGHAEAALYVARMYRDGKGMRQDTERARKYYKKAIAAGLTEAESELKALPESTVKKAKTAQQKRKK
ncbi:MAG: sel1 repeat family protein [Muribaculaceae bacterium]|nr:sel1 repeat family protein [Muribaculaceae bacterium]